MSLQPPIDFAMRTIPDNKYATQGFAFIGAAGSGKTTFLKRMIQSALSGYDPSSDLRAFIYDFKSELYPFIYSVLGAQCPGTPLYCINPFDTRCVWWDIAQDIERESDAQQIAAILIPKESGEKNPYYIDAARGVLANLFLSFHRHSPRDWTFRDFFNALSSKELYQLILKRDSDTATAVARSGSDETQANIDSTINNTYIKFRVLAALMDNAREHGNPSISVKNWVKSPGVIIANFDKTVQDVLEPYYRSFFHALKQHTLSLPDDEDRRSWFFFDEFHTLKPIPGFAEFVTNARSKGACMVLNFQNITTLLAEDHYGRNATSIVGECKNKMFFKASTFEHAEWCAKEYGMHEFIKHSKDSNFGTSTRISQGATETTFTQGNGYKVDFDHSYLRIPGEFQALPLVAETGVFEAFAILQSKRLHCSMGLEEATGPLLIPHPDHPGFLPTPPHWEDLRPWSQSDYAKLKLQLNEEDLFSIALNLKPRPLK